MNGQRWITVGVVLGLLALVFGLLLPAIQDAREAARRSDSKRNLQQIGLALHNYHETYTRLPPGGVIREDGTAMHGWLIRIYVFMTASPLYNNVDFQVPWNDFENQENYDETISYFLIPGVEAHYTSAGYGLTHYLGNPHLLYRNSSVKFKQMTNGTAHTWMVGEVVGNYQPWGYPFNWRSLGTKLCNGPNSYGHPPWQGGHLLLAYGGVEFFSNETSPEILKRFAAAPPVPTEEQIAVPEKRFETVGFYWTEVALQSDPENNTSYFVRILKNQKQQLLQIEFYLSTRPTEQQERDRTPLPGYPLPDLLARIDSDTDLPEVLKSASMSNATTPEQFQSNVKTLESLQKQLIQK